MHAQSAFLTSSEKNVRSKAKDSQVTLFVFSPDGTLEL